MCLSLGICTCGIQSYLYVCAHSLRLTAKSEEERLGTGLWKWDTATIRCVVTNVLGIESWNGLFSSLHGVYEVHEETEEDQTDEIVEDGIANCFCEGFDLLVETGDAA